MWIETKTVQTDLEYIISREYISWDKLKSKSVLVTGATGLIGYYIICSLLYSNLVKNSNIKVYALVRDLEKAKEKYKVQLAQGLKIVFIVGSVENLPAIEYKIDYIIHGANPTSSKYFIDYPVETIKTALTGTYNMLELAKKNNVQGFIYLSSMEVYGAPLKDDYLLEQSSTNIDTMAVRSSYPESKRMCENLCASYAAEYGINCKVIRLAQTFGPGVVFDDNRVFAEFARCAIMKQNIILKTEGTSKRSYLYLADAVTAVLTILVNGLPGNAYNAANKATYCSILEMAQKVACELTVNKINVIIKIDDLNSKKFVPTHHLNLQTEKLEKLGWKASTDLITAYKKMIEVMHP